MFYKDYELPYLTTINISNRNSGALPGSMIFVFALFNEYSHKNMLALLLVCLVTLQEFILNTKGEFKKNFNKKNTGKPRSKHDHMILKITI